MCFMNFINPSFYIFFPINPSIQLYIIKSNRTHTLDSQFDNKFKIKQRNNWVHSFSF